MNLVISPNKTNSTVSIHGDLIKKNNNNKMKLSPKNSEAENKIKKNLKIKEEVKEFTKDNNNNFIITPNKEKEKNMPNLTSINKDNFSNHSKEKERILKDSLHKKQPPNNSLKDSGSGFGINFNKGNNNNNNNIYYNSPNEFIAIDNKNFKSFSENNSSK